MKSFLRASLAILLIAAPLAAVAQAPPPPEASPPAPAVDDPPTVSFDGRIGLALAGLLGENVGGIVTPGLTILDTHTIQLALFVGGGSHLRTGVELRYDLQAADHINWWIGGGVAFDVLTVADLTIWSRLTTFSTGLDVALNDFLFLGAQLTLVPRAKPLAVTFIDDGSNTEQAQHEAGQLGFDLADTIFRPGLVFGLRM